MWANFGNRKSRRRANQSVGYLNGGVISIFTFYNRKEAIHNYNMCVCVYGLAKG